MKRKMKPSNIVESLRYRLKSSCLVAEFVKIHSVIEGKKSHQFRQEENAPSPLYHLQKKYLAMIVVGPMFVFVKRESLIYNPV